MADYLPQASGLWSTTTWITAFSNLTAFAGGNTPPAIIDDVYADGKTLYIDINTAVSTIRTTTTPRTGGLAGGGFILNNNITLSATCIAGTTTCLTFASAAPNIATLVGNISGSSTTSSIVGVNNSNTGILNIIGNTASGSQLNSYGVNNNTGTVNITGNIVGPSTAVNSSAGANNGSGIINMFGNVFAGNLPQNINGIVNSSTGGTINLVGVVYGSNTSTSVGIVNSGQTAVVNITGGAVSGGGTNPGSPGVLNSGSAAIVTVVGTVSGGNSVTQNSNPGISVTGPNSIVNVIGNVSSGQLTNGSNIGIANGSSTGVVNITGNVFGGPGSFLIGLTNTSSGTVSISGNVFGGSGNAGISNQSTGTINVTGNVIGGTGTNIPGITNTNVGFVYVYGAAIGGTGSGAMGANNVLTGLLYCTRAVGNGFGLGSVGIAGGAVGLANSQNGRAYVEQVEFGSRGQTPISGPVYILPSNRNTLTSYTTAVGAPVTFYNSLSVSGLLPPTSSVRLGTVYNVGNSVGTMAVPLASAVQFGVPVDNTIGTAALQPQDVWGYARLSATQVDSMGDRLRNTATTQSIGYQIASFNL